jgi:arylsulfatase A-like enzyme
MRCRLAAFSASLLLASCGDSPPASTATPAQPNVVILSIDTLRADHLGCYGYAAHSEPTSPAIDALCRDGLRFDHCFAPRGQTGPSLLAMLTGLYPSGHGLIDNYEGLRDETRDRIGDFGALGYEAHAFLAELPVKRSTVDALAGSFRSTAASRGSFFLASNELPRGTSQAQRDDAVEARLVDFLSRRKGAARPFLAWAHFYDVHQPYAPSADLHAAFAGDYHGALRLDPAPTEKSFDAVVKRHLDERMRAREPVAPADAKYVRSLYDAGIRATDARVGRIVAALRERGLLDSTLIVITADHGEALAERDGFWFHGNSLLDSVLRIPLIVRGPGVAAGKCDSLIQNVDLLPTLLELAGGKVPGGLDGLSFAAVVRGQRPDPPIREIAWAEWEDVVLAARTPSWKYLLNPRGARPKLPPFQSDDDPGYHLECRELYDVVADPLEAKNVWRERRGEIEALRMQVGDEYGRRFAGFTRGDTDPVDAARIAELEALGYGGTAAGEARRPNYRLDPAACEKE